MNKVLVIMIILFCIGCKSNEETKLLFIGNSLTYYNEMPGMLRQMFIEADVNIIIEQSTYPGFSLEGHLKSIIIKGDDDMIYTRPEKKGEMTATEKLLLQNDYDLIVLQERSGLMLLPEIVNNQIQNNISEIEKLVKNETQIYLYQNYPLNVKYPNVICREVESIEYCTDTIYSERQEMELISTSFESLRNGRKIVQIGEVFEYLIRNEKEINLFLDDVHPSKEGSFLIALKFYKDITGNRCSSLNYNGEINNVVARKLKETVDKM